VGDFDARFRDEVPDLAGLGLDRLHAVVHEEYLASALHLTQNGLPDQPPIIGAHVRGDRQAFLRGSLDRADVADPG